MLTSPTIFLENQFGEKSLNRIIGGSNAIDISFVVDHTNGNGLGVRSIKGPSGVKVFMNTSATPLGGNPNPAAGFILVELPKTYSGYLGGYAGDVSPVSGTPINVTSGLTAGAAYIITSLGTTSAAAWLALGVPAGVTAAVGVSFTAITAVAGSGTGVVQAPAASGSGIVKYDVIGDANLSSAPSVGGAYILTRCLAATSSSVTTLVATAPADGSVIGMRFVMGGSAQDPQI